MDLLLGFKTTMRIIMFCSLFSSTAFSQINKADIIKKYHIKDSLLDNKDAYLLLCKNNIFVNYGIYNNKAESEWYIWYASGTYEMKDGNIVCQSSKVINNPNLLIKDIKTSYKRRPDHILIDTDYEFVCEKYKDHSFDIKGNRATDSKKKLEYFEVN